MSEQTISELDVIHILCNLTDKIGWEETPENLQAFKEAVAEIMELIEGKP